MAEDGSQPPSTQSTQEIGAAESSVWNHKLLTPFLSLQNPNFRYLWLGQLGQAGSMWAEQVARTWLTWQMTGSATAIGLVNVFRAIPLITIGLLGGVVADRFDKRKILIIIQIWSLGIYVAMAVLILGDWIRLWHLYLTSFLMGLGMAMNQPVRTSFIPQILDARLLLNAISLNSIAINVMRLAGPAGIGFLIAAFNDNVGPAYVVASAIYVFVLLSTFMIRVDGKSDVQQTVSLFEDMIDGFRYMLFQNRTIVALIVMAMGPLAFAFSYVMLLPVFMTEVLGMGSTGFGAIQSISAIGALAGGLTLASMGHVPHKGKVMLVTGMTYGIIVMLLGLMQWPVLAFTSVIFVGASQTIFRAANNSTLLEITPTRYQGRVVSVTFLDMGMQSVAVMLAGVVTDVINVSVGMAFLGIACIIFVGAIWIGSPTIRRL